MSKIVIGIDPGANGALAVDLGNEVKVFRFCKMDEGVEPVLRGIKNTAEQHNMECVCFLEKVGAMPGQGVSTMFAFGENYGRCKGALRALQIPFELVSPQTWQKGLGLPQRAKEEDRKSFKVKHKKHLYQKAKDLFPTLATTQDTADALLIMRYGREIRK